MSGDCRLAAALARLLDVLHTLHPEDLPRVLEDAIADIGGRDVELYFADLAQDVLLRFSGDGDAELDIDATVAGRTFRQVETVALEVDDGVRLWVPLLDGTDRLGVLGAVFDAESDESARDLLRIGTLVAEMIVARSQYADTYAVARRRRPLSIASELRWAMLPPQAFATEDITIAAFVAPPYEIAGDSFDYAVNGRTAHVAVFDAMGHGLEASRMANLAIGSYRHARRIGLDLPATYAHVDAAVHGEFGDFRFVTGALAELDLDQGRLRLLLAGHPRPLLLRDLNFIGALETDPTLPFGIGDPEPIVEEFQLEPEDRLLLYSDGVIEARDGAGEPFGVTRLADFLVRAQASDEPAPETMRRLSRAVLAQQEGPLQDDATLLSLQWRRADI